MDALFAAAEAIVQKLEEYNIRKDTEVMRAGSDLERGMAKQAKEGQNVLIRCKDGL